MTTEPRNYNKITITFEVGNLVKILVKVKGLKLLRVMGRLHDYFAKLVIK